METSEATRKLKDWYLKNQRSLPWRQDRNPYLIWLSEVMLQQTTVQAVIPFFNRFRERFPNVHALAEAPLEDVLEQWAGLGYYSRARNLHKAAKSLSEKHSFPRSYRELLELPGFGDYTARAVASIAFDECVGVVDGNVIRILSRLYGRPFTWWKSKDKQLLQELADQMVSGESPSIINQAMMELGATVCTPVSPACTLCPWLKLCAAQKQGRIPELPIKRPKKDSLIVVLDLELIYCKGTLALTENTKLPFLKNSLLPPLTAMFVKKKPNRFEFKHSITHHQIYVRISTKVVKSKCSTYYWQPIETVAKANPSSLLKKALRGRPLPP